MCASATAHPSAKVQALLEDHITSLSGVLPDLSRALVTELVQAAATDWEQNTDLTLEALVENADPLFQLIHRKLIFQLFTERVQAYLKEDSQLKALEAVQEVYCKKFENLLVEPY